MRRTPMIIAMAVISLGASLVGQTPAPRTHRLEASRAFLERRLQVDRPHDAVL